MDTLADDVRALGTLEARLLDCRRRVGDMCVEGRPPRMSIPVRGTDDDIFICQTIDDALAALAGPKPISREEFGMVTLPNPPSRTVCGMNGESDEPRARNAGDGGKSCGEVASD